MKYYCLKNYWFALASPESDDITKVRGYIKLSISVLNYLDKIIDLKMSDKMNKISFPTKIQNNIRY